MDQSEIANLRTLEPGHGAAASAAPTFPGAPLVGHLPGMNRDMLGLLTTARDACGPIARLRLGHKTAHAVFSAELAEQVLIVQRDKFARHSTMASSEGLPMVPGGDLLMSTGDLWIKQRKLINPTFDHQSTARLADIVNYSGAAMLRRWDANVSSGGTVDFQEEMLLTTLEIFGKSMFGLDDVSDLRDIIDSINIGARTAFAAMKNPLHPPLSWPTKGNREFHSAMEALDRAVHRLIDARKGRESQQPDLLGALLDARREDGRPMSREQLRDAVVTIIGAGHETTAMALTWGCAALSRHPQAKQRLRDELDRVLGGREATMADLPNLPYLSHVFSEILRLYPTAPVIPRAVLEDAELDGYHIPAGSMIYASVYHIHRDPRWWEDPLTFRPERFEKGKPPHRCSYIPFGAGPRFCIGANMAELEAQLLLAQIYQHYDVEMCGKGEPFGEVAVTMRPRGGLPVRLRRRVFNRLALAA